MDAKYASGLYDTDNLAAAYNEGYDANTISLLTTDATFLPTAPHLPPNTPNKQRPYE